MFTYIFVLIKMGNQHCCQEKVMDEGSADYVYMKCHQDLYFLLDQLVVKEVNAGACPEGYEYTSICSNILCRSKALICSVDRCSVCAIRHSKCVKKDIRGVLESITNNISSERRFLEQLQEFQRSAFNDLQKNRNKLIKELIIPKLTSKLNLKQLLAGQDSNPSQLKNYVHNLQNQQQKWSEANSYLLEEYRRELGQLKEKIYKMQRQYLKMFQHKDVQFQQPHNPHNNFFSVRAQSIREVVVTYEKSDQHWYNFVKNVAIPENDVSVFKIKQLEKSQASIMVGVATSLIWGKVDSQECLEAFMYLTSDGSVFQNGLERPGGRQVKEGETITLTVDLINWKIGWSIDMETLFQKELIGRMRGKQLFLTVMTLKKGDRFSLRCE